MTIIELTSDTRDIKKPPLEQTSLGFWSEFDERGAKPKQVSEVRLTAV